MNGKKNTDLRLSDFLKNYLPEIYSFSLNKLGEFTFHKEQKLWEQGKMTAPFLKQVGGRLGFPTSQVSNYKLLYSLKNQREKLIELLKEQPELDQYIAIKTRPRLSALNHKKSKKEGPPASADL